MTNLFGVNLPTFSATPTKVDGLNRGGVDLGAIRHQHSFKTASYASIPYEKFPVLTDTVPTRDKNGAPLLPGYETPRNTWIA